MVKSCYARQSISQPRIRQERGQKIYCAVANMLSHLVFRNSGLPYKRVKIEVNEVISTLIGQGLIKKKTSIWALIYLMRVSRQISLSKLIEQHGLVPILAVAFSMALKFHVDSLESNEPFATVLGLEYSQLAHLEIQAVVSWDVSFLVGRGQFMRFYMRLSKQTENLVGVPVQTKSCANSTQAGVSQL